MCEDLYAGLMAWPLFQGAREPWRVVGRVVVWSALWAGAGVDGAGDGSSARE